MMQHVSFNFASIALPRIRRFCVDFFDSTLPQAHRGFILTVDRGNCVTLICLKWPLNQETAAII